MRPVIATFMDVTPGALWPVFAVAATAAVAAVISVAVSERGLLLPAVVVELLLGVIIGHQVLGLETTPLLAFMKSLGLGLLFFFAGYEIDLDRIKGQPLKLAVAGWAVSLLLAYSIGGLLAWAGVVVSLIYTGSALSTTALGTLMPILSDSGELKSRLGTNLLAAGAVGEFGPILLLSLFLSAGHPLDDAVTLVIFVVVVVAFCVLAVRFGNRTLPVMERTIERSSQIAVRAFFLLLVGLVLLASQLGLDLLLGGFAAGVIVRQLVGIRDVPVLESKLTAIAFGVFVPFFFIVSGMQLDVRSLFESFGAVMKVPLFFVLFLIVRGVPAMLLYRRVLDRGERVALALFSSTQLPLVLAITTVAVAAGQMRKTTAAALVAGAVLSTLVYPLLALRVREGSRDGAGGSTGPNSASA